MRNETTNVKKTLIISAFPACGKTYLYKNQHAMMFKYLGADRLFSFCDLDSSKYEKYEGWEKQYVDDIEKKLGTVDFVFVSQYKKVLAELSNRRLPFIVVAPDNSTWLSDRVK